MRHKRVNNFILNYELGYILGVYFGDGSIVHESSDTNAGKSWFSLTTIDIEFAEYVRECFSIFVGPIEGGIGKYIDQRKGRKPQYHFRITASDFCRMLSTIAPDKTLIPGIVHSHQSLKKGFIEGFLDSEGWVSKTKEICNNPKSKYHGHHQYRIGFGCTNKFVMIEMGKFLQEFNVGINKLMQDPIPSGKMFYRYFLNIDSFVASPLRFIIKRKQQRLDEYKSLISFSTTTNHNPETRVIV